MSQMIVAGLALVATAALSGCVQNKYLAETGGCRPGIEDFETRVTGGRNCLAIRKDSGNNPNDDRVVVYIGGDNPDDIPVDIDWERIVRAGADVPEFGEITKYVIARPKHFLVRDGKGYRRSSGDSCMRTEVCYSEKNMDSMADAIRRIAAHEEAIRGRPVKIIGMGFSGGGNHIASIAGRPEGVKFAHLFGIAGTYNYNMWINTTGKDSVRRSAHRTSPSAIDFVDGIQPGVTRVTLVYSSRDTNVVPKVALAFHDELVKRGVDSVAFDTDGDGHWRVPEGPRFAAALQRMLDLTR